MTKEQPCVPVSTWHLRALCVILAVLLCFSHPIFKAGQRFGSPCLEGIAMDVGSAGVCLLNLGVLW